MTSPIDSCRIWGETYEATGFVKHDPSVAVVENSDRAGGGYVIGGSVRPWIKELNDQEKARLTTWLIDQRSRENEQPEITKDVVQYVRNHRPLPVHERAERLLRFIVDQLKTVSDALEIHEQTFAAYAYSESTDFDDISYFLSYLNDLGWIDLRGSSFGSRRVTVTVAGYSRIEEQTTNVDSSQAFVAMWFHESTVDAFEDGVEPAIEQAGYKALRIDRKEHVNKIDDEIIAELRRSRFVVADFTHGDDGARGGVYYEAGFAHGLKLPVVFTCRKDKMKTLHFDISHFNHVVWTDPADLREKLKNRILAAIGEGPEAQAHL